MGLRRVLKGYWFNRLVLVAWITCAVLIFLFLKGIELIVHGQLYYFGLNFSPAWADPYRIYTWLIYICLGFPMVLSGVALVSSFIKETDKVPERKIPVEQKVRLQPVAREEPKPVGKDQSKLVENSNGEGIPCPQCKKVFSKALVMLDFRSGKPKLVSVCPYCSCVLGNTRDATRVNDGVHGVDVKKLGL